MGHCQELDKLNLGMGWLYYGLVRLLHPGKIVVIGSWRGFAPLVFAKGLLDNAEGGRVWFIDPSLVDDFWKEPVKVQAHFASFGVNNIQHFLMTTQEFVLTDAYRELEDIGIIFVDGLHTAEQARFDYESFVHKLSANGIALFHDSMTVSKPTWLYGEENVYERRIPDFIDQLKQKPDLQILDLPFAKGLTLVRKIADAGHAFQKQVP
jgi:predicted O-methyltransferase YrrM